ncbi:YrhK family protein [Alkalihalophilus lindianensis]|uniref:YrhK family protein n=1 Tax=Alkalihalophilus lindianensis TaxID=1630542 RepID=A0ABU3X8Q7_9BACI|nr:YrhK family protein [Alkalihalophilus lindianensis]MDV2683688.1 YrhK family protein [Alkalihalophilus lindianensis]
MKRKVPKIKNGEEYLDVKMGRMRIYFDKRYRVISTINDLLIGILFVVGSILNFFDEAEMIGLISYLAGSTFLVARPILRLMHSATLRKEIQDKDTYTTDDD